MDTLNSIFTWVGIIAAFLSAFSFLGTWWTGKIIDDKKTKQIIELQNVVSSIQPEIFSQAPKMLNELDGGLFKQTYTLSINSPQSNMVIFTELKSSANKVGGLEDLVPTTSKGVRIQRNIHVPYQDYDLSFRTDKQINIDTDEVKFTTKAKQNTP